MFLLHLPLLLLILLLLLLLLQLLLLNLLMLLRTSPIFTMVSPFACVVDLWVRKIGGKGGSPISFLWETTLHVTHFYML